jgi:hypothetical protein
MVEVATSRHFSAGGAGPARWFDPELMNAEGRGERRVLGKWPRPLAFLAARQRRVQRTRRVSFRTWRKYMPTARNSSRRRGDGSPPAPPLFENIPDVLRPQAARKGADVPRACSCHVSFVCGSSSSSSNRSIDRSIDPSFDRALGEGLTAAAAAALGVRCQEHGGPMIRRDLTGGGKAEHARCRQREGRANHRGLGRCGAW